MNNEKLRIMRENVIMDKSMSFAIRVVKMYQWLCEEKKEYVISKQLLRSGTSIGANLWEAQGAISKKEFVKIAQISLKECKESVYWIELLHNTEYIDEKMYVSLNKDIVEIEKLLTSILKSTKMACHY